MNTSGTWGTLIICTMPDENMETDVTQHLGEGTYTELEKIVELWGH